MPANPQSNTGNYERETPDDLFNAVNSIFNFNLDAAATSENAKCSKYFTKEDNGLIQSWSGKRVWLNPPYNKELIRKGIKGIYNWLEKVCEERSRTEIIVVLCPIDPSTAWSKKFIQQANYFWPLPHRVKFVGTPGGINCPIALHIFLPTSPEKPLFNYFNYERKMK